MAYAGYVDPLDMQRTIDMHRRTLECMSSVQYIRACKRTLDTYRNGEEVPQGSAGLQGYLAHKKTYSPRTLQ